MTFLGHPDFGHKLTQIDLRTGLQRKSDFLQPLVVSLIALHLIALVIMLIPPASALDNFAIAIVGLLLNITSFFLNRSGRTLLAAHLFCYSVNVATFLLFFLSLTVDSDLSNAALFGSLLSLSVLLAGMVISATATLWFAALNSGFIFVTFLYIGSPLLAAIALSFPSAAFLWLIALISWLYQRTLSQALRRLREARQELMQTELLQRDLEIARDLQFKLFPAAPLVGSNLAIASRCEPAQETSGDFYDFIELRPNELGIVVADVTGHSLPAAMMMTMTRSILRNEARRATSPAEVLRQTNQTLLSDASVDKMVTAFYGVLNTQSMALNFSNAGHPFPILKRNGQIRELDIPGLPLRSFSDAHYEQRQMQLHPGDQLVLISDGVVEAMNVQREMFGFERFAETIRTADTRRPQHLLQLILEAVTSFQAGAEQEDDIAVVVIQTGPIEAAGEESYDDDQPQMQTLA
jgi:serine phosphatase RsbU (regulator of sigma subunit)